MARWHLPRSDSGGNRDLSAMATFLNAPFAVSAACSSYQRWSGRADRLCLNRHLKDGADSPLRGSVQVDTIRQLQGGLALPISGGHQKTCDRIDFEAE